MKNVGGRKWPVAEGGWKSRHPVSRKYEKGWRGGGRTTSGSGVESKGIEGGGRRHVKKGTAYRKKRSSRKRTPGQPRKESIKSPHVGKKHAGGEKKKGKKPKTNPTGNAKVPSREEVIQRMWAK